MKKIYNFLFISLCCIFAAGCSSDDNNSEISTLSVVKSIVSFGADPGTGTIEVSSINSISATSTESWCTVSVAGQEVTVTVTSNQGLEGRTALVTITSDLEKVSVPVTQSGAIFSLDNSAKVLFASSIGETINVAFKSTLPYDIIIDNDAKDWLTATKTDTGFTLVAAENETQKPRRASILLSNGKSQANIVLTQISYTDLLGSWVMSYTNNKGVTVTANATLSQNVAESSYVLKGLPLGSQLVVNYDKGTLRMDGGQYLGFLDPYYVYLCMYSSSVGSLTWLTTVQYEAPLSFLDKVPTYAFGDNGSWDYPVEGFLFYAFDAETPTSDGALGSFASIINLKLEKK